MLTGRLRRVGRSMFISFFFRFDWPLFGPEAALNSEPLNPKNL